MGFQGSVLEFQYSLEREENYEKSQPREPGMCTIFEQDTSFIKV